MFPRVQPLVPIWPPAPCLPHGDAVLEKGLGEPQAVAWTVRSQRCVMGAIALPAFNLSSTVKWLALGCKQLGEGLKKMWTLGYIEGLDTTYAEC